MCACSVIPMSFVTAWFPTVCRPKEYCSSSERNLRVLFSSYFSAGTMRNVRCFIHSVVSSVVGTSPP